VDWSVPGVGFKRRSLFIKPLGILDFLSRYEEDDETTDQAERP